MTDNSRNELAQMLQRPFQRPFHSNFTYRSHTTAKVNSTRSSQINDTRPKEWIGGEFGQESLVRPNGMRDLNEDGSKRNNAHEKERKVSFKMCE